VTNKPKRRYRIRNWPDYNSALVRRGSLTLWVEHGVVNRWRETAAPVRRGRRRFYSDLAVTCALTLREVYHLPLRSTRGLASSVLRLLGSELPAPHYSTLSRRAASLEVKLPRLSNGPLHLAVDPAGGEALRRGGVEGETPRAEKRRTWRKLHLVIDHTTHEAVALSMTDKDTLDRRELSGLLSEVEGEVAEVLGDGAYDFQDCYKAIRAKGARSVIRRRCGHGSGAGRSSVTATLRCYAGSREGRVEEGGGLPPPLLSRDGDDEAEDGLLR
jgi:hypothetical protein